MANSKQILFKIARSRHAGYFIGTAFEYLSSLMPLKAIYKNAAVIIFPHPVPFWEIHFLAVPKKRLSSFVSLNLESQVTQHLMIDLFQAIQQATTALGLSTFTILVNGGAYQDVPQIHFHIAQGKSKQGVHLGQEDFQSLDHDDPTLHLNGAIAYKHPRPLRPTHWIITSAKAIAPFSGLSLAEASAQQVLVESLQLAQRIVENEALNAYTLLIHSGYTLANPQLAFHLVSG